MRLVKLSILFLSLFFFLSAHDASALERTSGENRYQTAVEISHKGWPEGASTVILATGKSFPDSLAAGPLAYKLDAPILLTEPQSLHHTTKQEIKRLQSSKVIIIGGSAAVSHQVEKELQALGINVERIAGASRYGTASSIAERLNFDKAVIVNGENFPDALSISAYAAINEIPILLTSQDVLPDETHATLKQVTNTIIMGGTAVVSNKVFNQLPSPMRISGSDRYSTNSMSVNMLGEWSNKAIIATGENFADALSGSVLAAKFNAPILLVGSDRIPPTIYSLLENFNDYTVLGGEGVISGSVLGSIRNFHNPPADELPEEPEKPDPVTPIEYLALNTPYTSSENNMTVTMKNIETINHEGFNEYRITYLQENKTTDSVIPEGTFKIFYDDGSSEAQYGFFDDLYPGESRERVYSFKSVLTKNPLLVEYSSDNFFNPLPSENTLKWRLDNPQ